MRSHRWQPTRLPHPWDSPGKNTGVGCHFLLQCVKVKSLSRVQLLVILWTTAYQAPPSVGLSRQEYWSGVPLPSPCMHAVHSKSQFWSSETDLDEKNSLIIHAIFKTLYIDGIVLRNYQIKRWIICLFDNLITDGWWMIFLVRKQDNLIRVDTLRTIFIKEIAF